MDSAFPQAAEDKLKSYWHRPAGKIGALVGLLGLGVIGWKVLPILTAIVWNAVNFGLACLVLMGLIFLVSNKKVRLALYYLWEIFIRSTVGIIWELDPFIAAEDQIKDMEKQREKLDEQLTNVVDAQKEELKATMDEKEREIVQLTREAKVAERSKAPELGNMMRQIERLQMYVKRLSPIFENLLHISEYLTKVYKNSALLIADARNELDIQKELYRYVTAGNKALTIARKLFQGDPEKKFMAEQSAAFLKKDIATKLANMKRAMSASTEYMRSIDITNATFEEEGMKMLAKFDPDKDFQLTSTKIQQSVVPAQHQLGEINVTEYDKLLQ